MSNIDTIVFGILILSFIFIIYIIYWFCRIKCVKCGHKGMLKEKDSKLYCRKCGFDYGYIDE